MYVCFFILITFKVKSEKVKSINLETTTSINPDKIKFINTFYDYFGGLDNAVQIVPLFTTLHKKRYPFVPCVPYFVVTFTAHNYDQHSTDNKIVVSLNKIKHIFLIIGHSYEATLHHKRVTFVEIWCIRFYTSKL